MKLTSFKTILLPLFISVIYFIFNINFIINHNFNEDAYILFRYADMFNKGYGITYYPNASPIEGATDFLWLMLIIFVSKLGLDIGTSAILLNSVGVFIITYILLAKISSINKPLFRYLFGVISLIWILFYPLLAALGGFSVMLYCGLFILPLFLIDQRKLLEYIPLFSLILALFRPDGVLLGIGLSCVSLFSIIKSKNNILLRRFLITSVSAVILGLLYFIWRYNYFGNLLPLPLYVKQTAGFVSSFVQNFYLSFGYKHIYLYLIAFAILVLLNFKLAKNKLILLFPAFLLFIMISGSHQSQNIGFRFQSTIIISMIYVTVSILVNVLNNPNGKNKMFYLFIPLLFLISGKKVIDELIFYYSSNSKSISIPEFVYRFSNEVLDGNEVLAITEAGYYSFYQQKGNKLIDLVGLNTPDIAINSLNENYYNKLSPDIIYFMRENKIDPSKFNRKLYYLVKDKQEFYSSYDTRAIREQAKLSKVPLATIQSIDYLNHNWDNYDVYFIRYRKNAPNRLSEYVIALKKSLNKSNKMETLLDSLQNTNKEKGYFDLLDE